jgi:CheY-like chemotaxis protein/HPt (histidine-containing phosphotransfer) domain-containing protein
MEKYSSQKTTTDLNRSTVAQKHECLDTKLSGHILIAEDNEVNQKLVQAMLEKTGLKITFANDGLEVLEKVAPEQYNLILMDIHMPNMDGFETTKSLRDSGLDIPIIALTADVMKQEVDKCLEVGCNEHLSKPIDRNKLMNLLESYLSPENTSLAESLDSVNNQVNELCRLTKSRQAPQEEPSADQTKEDIKSPIDWSMVVENFFEDEELLMEIVGIYLEETPQIIEKLVDAIKTGTLEEVELHAHSLKGTSAQIAAAQLQEKSRLLEFAAKEKNTETFESLFNDVKKEYDSLMSFLSKENWRQIAKEQNCTQQNKR